MLAGPACAPEPPVDVAALAARYVQLTRGLARHDPSLIDHWLEPPPADDTPRVPVATLRAGTDRLAGDVAAALPRTSGPERRRAEHLDGQVRALQLAARRLLGESLPFDAEARLGLGLDPMRPNLVRIETAREALDAELPGTDPLAERVARFRTAFLVPDDLREATLHAALDVCREATLAAGLPLPAGESVEVVLVHGLPWDAHAQYVGSHRTRIDVNASQPMDVARALRIACHEGYPGHHAQHLWMAGTLVAERGWTEFALVPGFGPSLLVAEGAAEAGSDVAVPPERRANIYQRRLAPTAGLAHVPPEAWARLVRVETLLADIEPIVGDVARAYLDNHINGAATEERLAAEALLPAPEAFVPFIERRRTRVLAYPEGRRLVTRRLADRGLLALHTVFTDDALTLPVAR